MTSGPTRRIRWGSVCGDAFFYAFIVSIGLGATFHWRWLGLMYAFVYLGALVVGSAALLWRAWHEPGGVGLGELAALPRSWRKWVLGEADDKPEAQGAVRAWPPGPARDAVEGRRRGAMAAVKTPMLCG